MKTKVIVLLAAVFMVTALFGGMVYAEPPAGEREAVDVDSLVRQVLSSPDPKATFYTLAETEQEAVAEALANPVVTHRSYVVSDAMASSADDAQAYERCATHVDYREGKYAGLILWVFQTSTRFCYDGDVLTRDPRVTYYKRATWPWHWVRLMYLNWTGEAGDEHNYDYASGYFKFCPIVTCTEHEYPVINKWQYGDGTTDPD